MTTFFRFSLLILVLGTSCLGMSAQDQAVTFGVKAGVNGSHFGGKLDSQGLADINPRFGYNAGVTLDLAFSEHIYLLTGLEFTNKGAYEFRKGKRVSIDASYISMPLHFGYKLKIDDNPTFVAHIGPYVAYGVSGKTRVRELGVKQNTFSAEGFKKLDFGLGLAVGGEFDKIVVELGHNLGFPDVSQAKEKIRTRNFYATVGYKF